MKVSIKNIILPSIPFAILLVFSCILIWISSYFSNQLIVSTNQNVPVVGFESFFLLNSLLSNIIAFVFTLVNALLLAQINNRFTIIRTRTFLPLVVFLFLMSSWGHTHIVNGSHLALTFNTFALFYFFSMARDRNATEAAFMGTFLVSLSSLFVLPFFFLIPICWIGFLIFQSFSLRTFFASILGAFVPWILFLSGKYIIESELNIHEILQLQPNFGFSIAEIPQQILIYAIVFTCILVISIIGMYSLSNGDVIHTRNKLNFLVLLLFTLIVLSLIFRSQFSSFLPFIALVFSLIFSHPFSLRQNNFYAIIFFVFFVLNLSYVMYRFFPIV